MDTTYKQVFAEADRLFRQGSYVESKALLLQLNQQFPNQKNILYPLALCHAKLGGAEQAIEICWQLESLFQDPRASLLRQELSDAVQLAPLAEEVQTNLSTSLADLVQAPTAPAQTTKNTDLAFEWKRIVFGGLLLAMVGAILFVLFLPLISSYQPETPESVTVTTTSTTMELTPVGRMIVEALIGFVLNVIALYIGLAVMDKHTHADFRSNLRDTAIVSALLAITGMIPILGFILYFVILMKSYDLEIWEVILLALVCMVLSLTIGFLFLPLLVALNA